ncbi:potassium channel family protein [Paenibacillus mucilaginosus]|uniref:Trk system potassium uptake protein trkA n=3 Tax=Paenibacillus mucilaginosus TaxID=61624 RepID=H6NFT0_9BACL|nr:TrkA family potassium uptake protein [Paenibacillus mucilaginosus]AEI43033.1 trk system potassium uptake protein trkA [Paenibacillus mucilaginosus KNP414]AFC30720.1 trk system potassium uptake protein trkA [Paenibacillus mucilaginosus 3016]AFH63038.1 potassium transporter Trk [Paenibacillus mucilaginosus K02]MCG7215973.1 TrkA family potassium uptake protein [Paenibacillus mucilaginosus]WDM24658.1 TrkA family potassium uptake protein [Paenibacillus mucilaginosus]
MKMRQFSVIGLGRFGSSLAMTLMNEGCEVLGIDKNEEIINNMADRLTHVVVADTTEEEVLRSLGIRNMDCVIVAIGDDIQASIMTALLLKDLGVRMIVAKALSMLHGKVLERIGVDRVIFPERDMGVRVAHQLINPNLLDYIELSNDYRIAELTVPRELSGLTLKELDSRQKYGFSVVAINKKNRVIVAPTAEDLIEEKDLMVIIGNQVQIENFEQCVESFKN